MSKVFHPSVDMILWAYQSLYFFRLGNCSSKLCENGHFDETFSGHITKGHFLVTLSLRPNLNSKCLYIRFFINDRRNIDTRISRTATLHASLWVWCIWGAWRLRNSAEFGGSHPLVKLRLIGCTGGVQGVYRGCTGGVQGVYRGCTGGVQGVYRGCKICY